MRITLLIAFLALAGCDIAPPPDRQAEAEKKAEAKQAEEHTELRDAIQTPIDRAKAANEPNEKAAEDQRKAIEDAGG